MREREVFTFGTGESAFDCHGTLDARSAAGVTLGSGWVFLGDFGNHIDYLFCCSSCFLVSSIVQPLARGLCGFSTGKFVPQELKPRFQAGSNGTTEQAAEK